MKRRSREILLLQALLLPALLLSMCLAGCASKKQGQGGDEYEGMQRRLREAPPEVSRMAKEYFDAGIRAYDAGEYERAVDLWRKAIAVEGPGFAYAARSYYNIGLAYLRMGRYEWARDELVRAAALEPDNYDIQFSLANTYIHLKEYSEAADALKRCTEMRGEDPEIFNTLGVCRLNSGDYPDAVVAFMEALALKPGFPEALSNLELTYLNWAVDLYNQGDYSGAIQRYGQALEQNPKNGRIYYSIAGTFLMMGDFDRAVQAYRTAHEMAPELAEEEENNLIAEYARDAGSDPDVYIRMAELYLGRGQNEAAVVEYKKAVAARPKDYDLYLKLARIYADKLNDRESAVRWYHAFLSANPDDPRAASIRREIAKETAPPPDPNRKPELVAMAAGLAYDPASGSVMGPGDRFPSGSKVYRVVRIRNLWGKHVVIRRLIRPSGKFQYEENITKEFFQDEVSFVSVDKCVPRGTWRQEWTVDGVPLGTLEFLIY